MIERLKQLVDGVSFHRGLALGALVGAAIAGSTLWSKVRGGRETPEEAGRTDRSAAASGRGRQS